jgi:cytochrome c-type biogenesis protein
MMNDIFLNSCIALWLGILTSISPCPLATNIAAISFIGRNVGKPRMVLMTGILYTLGRTITYLVLGVLLVSSLLSAPYISFILQDYMNKIMGPVLVIVGMFLLELISFNLPGLGVGQKLQNKAQTWGCWGGALLGCIFALTFCPVSAALFFGSLITIAVKCGSSILFPSLYGIGTGLPVFAFALVIALSAHSIGSIFNKINQFEKWARKITGIIFIVVGIYLSLKNIFQII